MMKNYASLHCSKVFPPFLPKWRCVFILMLGFHTLFLIIPSEVQANKGGSSKEKRSSQKSLNAEEMIALDQFEWVTLSSQTLPDFPQIKQAIESRTSIILNPHPRSIPYTPNLLKKYPFLHWEMCGSPPSSSLEEQLNWRDFFNRGGLLYLDLCAQGESPVGQWKQWSASIYPTTQWKPLVPQDVLAFSFYLLEKIDLLGKGQRDLYVLENDGRLMMVLNQNPDLNWNLFSQSKVDNGWNSPATEQALRFYINLMMVALTGSYKKDQLHLPTILLRRK